MRTELTQVYLEPARKKALQAKARAHGTKLAEEVRRAIDAYVVGVVVSAEELKQLDERSRKAARHVNEMSQEIDRINARLDDAFANLACQRAKARRKCT